MKKSPHRMPYLIVGNSVAAAGAVEGIRQFDAHGPITVVGKEPHHVYSRPLIPYLVSGKIHEDRLPYRDPNFYDRNHVETMLGVEATGLDTRLRIVELSDGTRIEFQRLLVATGARPIVPGNIPGTDAEGVFTLTSLEDAQAIRAFINENGVRQAVVVGAGQIGLKSLEALTALGMSVTLVELADRVLSSTFDRSASELALRALEEAGVTVYCRTTISQVIQQRGTVSGVTLRDGTRIPCSLVLLAIGVTPNLELVRDTPITVDRGVITDHHMQTSVDGIYAAGDVAQAPDFLREGTRLTPILPNAYRQGHIAGVNMAGGRRAYEGGLMMNAVDICGVPGISVGITESDGEGYQTMSTLDERAHTYKKIVLRDDCIVGAILLSEIQQAGIIAGLIRHRINVSSFRDLLLTDQFGLICLPAEYRKHLVSGVGIEA